MDYRETMTRLSSALHSVDAAYAVIAKKYGLTFNALMILYLIDVSDNISQRRVCDELFLSKSTVHSVLLDLIKRDYVALVDGNNKKEKFIVTTPTGNELSQEILGETYLMEKRVLDAIGVESCVILTEIAEKVENLMTKEITAMSGVGVE